MNPSKAWNAKLEAASFLPSKNLYNQCETHARTFLALIILSIEQGAKSLLS